MKIVYTDLDGTFLDHNTYSYERSLPALKKLTSAGIPCIFVSSKTFDEMQNLCEELQLMMPFIFENGGGIAEYRTSLGTYEVTLLGKSFEQLCEAKDLLKKTIACDIISFEELSVDELMEHTHLLRDRAELALLRRASLPFLLKDTQCSIDIEAANKILAEQDLQITRGGRFYHFFSKNTSKGSAVRFLNSSFVEKTGEKLLSMGIGDSLNDVPMLEAVDVAYLVRRHDGTHLEGYNFNKADGIGPEGFAEAVAHFLEV